MNVFNILSIAAMVVTIAAALHTRRLAHKTRQTLDFGLRMHAARCNETIDGMRCTKLEGHTNDHALSWTDLTVLGYVKPPF